MLELNEETWWFIQKNVEIWQLEFNPKNTFRKQKNFSLSQEKKIKN
jgi:hypothetical protein